VRLLGFVALTVLPLTALAQAPSVEEGVTLYKTGKPAEAKAALLPAGNRDAVAAYYLGRIAMDAQQYGEAADRFERAVKLDERNSVYWDWLGRAYGSEAQRASKLKQPFLAKKTKSAWEKAVALDPDNLDAREDLITFHLQAPGFMGGSVDKARESAREIRRRNPYRGALAAVAVCTHDKDMPCAEREYRELIATYPDSGRPYVLLAVLLANDKQYDQAFAILDQRLRAKPDDMQALYQVGRTGALSGRNLDRAAAALQAYIASPPEGASLAPAHHRLGMIYEKQGSTELARREYETALQIDPKYEPAKQALRK
jgi:tetratricopeptide (TPR) repeat protein